MTTYDFRDQLAQGQQGEAYLDSVFAERYAITPASDAEQRQGIDRWFLRRDNQMQRFAVEYKTDETAGKTGNAFIETVSVDAADKRGWAYTSKAQRLIYSVPTKRVIYVIQMLDLRQFVAHWAMRYPPKEAANDGYTTHGFIVPLTEIEHIAEVQILTWCGLWVRSSSTKRF